MKTKLSMLMICVFLLSGICFAEEDADNAVYPVAVLQFQDRSREVTGQGKIVADILFANLVTNSSLLLVDREDFDTVVREQEINISGVVSPDQAIKIGNLIGAKILITGSVIQTESATYLVAKLIGTETTRVLGASIKGSVNDTIDTLAEQLAVDVARTILADGTKLVAKPLTQKNRIAALKKKVKDKTFPAIVVDIPETYLSQHTADPAAETEFALYAKELGIAVFDKKAADRNKADILFVGEGFSERALPVGNLISVKARVELKAVDRITGEVIAIDRQTTVAVDITESVAAKTALQQAGAILAERIIPKLGKQ
ncbi:MAG: CsgG/HfaB family protein [Planctomycetaceae bacterium]|jgi:hypothetical protein|nr:CsgG/HfaB family protein [Planctomycetaceae bacterium]